MRIYCARNSTLAKVEISATGGEHAADARARFGCLRLSKNPKTAAGENMSAGTCTNLIGYRSQTLIFSGGRKRELNTRHTQIPAIQQHHETVRSKRRRTTRLHASATISTRAQSSRVVPRRLEKRVMKTRNVDTLYAA